MTTSKHKHCQLSRLERALKVYDPAIDGSYISITALVKIMPDISPATWQARLNGSNVDGTGGKTIPLLGRILRSQPVILASSMLTYLAHYNPGVDVSDLVDSMVQMTIKKEQYLKSKRHVPINRRLVQP